MTKLKVKKASKRSQTGNVKSQKDEVNSQKGDVKRRN